MHNSRWATRSTRTDDETIEGLQRFPINVRYPREVRDSVENLRNLPLLTERGVQIRLRDVTVIRVADGPPMLKSENARLSGWIYVDVRGRDLLSTVRDMQHVVSQEVTMPAGYSVSWSGQFEYLERAPAKLRVVAPATLLIIFVLLYLTFRNFANALLVMATLPFALVGGFWLMYLLGYNMPIAVGGMITAAMLSMFVIPAAFRLIRHRQSRRPAPSSVTTTSRETDPALVGEAS